VLKHGNPMSDTIKPLLDDLTKGLEHVAEITHAVEAGESSAIAQKLRNLKEFVGEKVGTPNHAGNRPITGAVRVEKNNGQGGNER
jgi:hypothetical protein